MAAVDVDAGLRVRRAARVRGRTRSARIDMYTAVVKYCYQSVWCSKLDVRVGEVPGEKGC